MASELKNILPYDKLKFRKILDALKYIITVISQGYYNSVPQTLHQLSVSPISLSSYHNAVCVVVHIFH